jgi:lysophospholipid acyltransferase (LPLAT)-like uncharacterized protein
MTYELKVKLKWYERCLVRLLYLLIIIWWSTLRIRTGKTFKRLCASDCNHIFALWHQNLFLTGFLGRRFCTSRPLYAMISASKDGEWLTELLSLLHINAIRGSSHRGAFQVYQKAIHTLMAGNDLAITPDGPRGPKFRCKPGIVHMALTTHKSIAIIRIRCHCALNLKSWDGFKIPLPFSRVSVVAVSVSEENLIHRGTLCQQLSFVERLLR